MVRQQREMTANPNQQREPASSVAFEPFIINWPTLTSFELGKDAFDDWPTLLKLR
jgi:hypothetical protein